MAGKYLDDLCKAICCELANQQKYDRSHRVCTGGLDAGSPSLLLRSVNEGGEEHVQLPVGHADTPWSKPRKVIFAFCEHWVDSRHEAEGTGRLYIVTDNFEGTRSCGYVHTVFKDGEATLRRDLNTIIEQYSGCVECWDDVGSVPLEIKLMREAHDLEMALSKSMGVWSETFPNATVKARGGRAI